LFARPTNTRSRRAFVIGCTFFSSSHCTCRTRRKQNNNNNIYNARTRISYHSTRTKTFVVVVVIIITLLILFPVCSFVTIYFLSCTRLLYFRIRAQQSDRPAGCRRRVERENNRALYPYPPPHAHTRTLTRSPGPIVIAVASSKCARSYLRPEEAVARGIYI